MSIIFDLDGTLVDSAPAILKGFAQALAAFDRQPVCPLDEKLIGPPLLTTLRKLSGIEDEQQIAAMADVFRGWYDAEGFRETVVYDGVDASLFDLADTGVNLYIATNKRLGPTLAILDFLGWTPLFRAIYALDRVVPAYRDKTAMLSALLAEQNVDVAQSIYVGDTIADYQAASGNGLAFAAAAWGYGDVAALACPQLDQPAALISLAKR